jgi:alpha-beta hydrolase superfamily lysophospholipase
MQGSGFGLKLRLAALAGLLGLCGPATAAMYDVKPDEIPGKPGTIIRVYPLEGGGAGVVGKGNAFRVVYRSTGPGGEPIAVSGAFFIPAGPAPTGGRDAIAWAHPTSGVVPPCAPSLMPDTAGLIWGLGDMLARDYVVAATDYPGLGTPGVHPYLIGESEGRSVLDSVRAARDLPDSGASGRFAVWGHSQGGHAALYTGELAARYAPDLKLVGVAAAAPATYLVELFDADKSSPTGKELTAMALWSWSKLYQDPVTPVVEPDAMNVFETMAQDCIESISQFEALDKAERPLQREQFLKIDPTEVEPWEGIMARNSPGQSPAGAPVFIAQGTADTTVRPEITKRFGEALCKQGARVSFVEMQGVTHTFIARDSASAALQWMTDRFRGLPAHSDCE